MSFLNLLLKLFKLHEVVEVGLDSWIEETTEDVITNTFFHQQSHKFKVIGSSAIQVPTIQFDTVCLHKSELVILQKEQQLCQQLIIDILRLADALLGNDGHPVLKERSYRLWNRDVVRKLFSFFGNDALDLFSPDFDFEIVFPFFELPQTHYYIKRSDKHRI